MPLTDKFKKKRSFSSTAGSAFRSLVPCSPSDHQLQQPRHDTDQGGPAIAASAPAATAAPLAAPADEQQLVVLARGRGAAPQRPPPPAPVATFGALSQAQLLPHCLHDLPPQVGWRRGVWHFS